MTQSGAGESDEATVRGRARVLTMAAIAGLAATAAIGATAMGVTFVLAALLLARHRTAHPADTAAHPGDTAGPVTDTGDLTARALDRQVRSVIPEGDPS